MLNTEIREYVSQMNQEEKEELKSFIRKTNECDQISLEFRIKRAVEIVSTEHQWKCINTNRNFVLNEFDRGTGKTVGIVLEILYNMENCKVKTMNKEGFKYFISTFISVVGFLNEYLNEEDVLSVECLQINREDFVLEITFGNNIFNVYSFGYIKYADVLYCDDCIPFTTMESFNKVRAYITETNVFKLLNQCHKNTSKATIEEHYEEIKNKKWRCSI